VAVVLFWSSESLAAAWQFPELSFNEALAFAAMICAVDPVATCDTFNELKVDHQLEILVVGESLVNDAAAIVLFKTFKEWVLFEDTQNNVTALGAIGDFSYFVFVSCIIGLAVGVACSLLYKHISFKDNPGLEITIFLLLSYSTFLVAEFWHCSGILSSLVGGVVMSSYAQRNLTDFDESLGAHSTGAKGMLQMLAALANMVIFLMVGMALVVCMDSFNLLFTLLVLVFTLVARALAVFPLTYVINMVTYARSGGTGKQIPWSHAVMMWWSGLRGAVALALAVDMPSRHRYMFTSTTCVLIAVTALFYGGRTPAMLKRLKVATGVPHDDGQDWNIGSNARGVAKWNEKVVEPLLISKAYRKQRKQRASVAAAAEGEKQDAAATAQELAGARRKLASLTALLEETQKDAIDYSRNKERQIESIYRQVDRDASKRTRCCGARLLMMVANFLLFLAGCAGLVVGILMLASEFAVGAVRTAALVLFVACIVIMLISFLGFTGAATRSNWWLVPYTVLLLGAMTLEVFALALAFDYNATLRRASASDFDAAKVEAVVGVLGAVRDIDAMAHVREVANITFVASGCASSVHYANATATGGGLLALSCSASAWVDGFVGSKCTARQPNATAFVSCRRAHHTEMRSNTDLYCACRDGVVALLEENTKLMAAVGCGLAGFQLLLVVFSCALITARFFGEHEEHDKEHLNDELYLDKDVIKVTKKLAEAKDSAIARLQKERQKEQAKQKKLQKQDKKKNSPKKKKKSDAREVLVETGHKVIV
jgi:NhaP-type Na+/H+ or K+/H+ antiporter